ncbi:MAG: hypothetical protein NT001_07820 [Candidatus Woesearchaeota archaeon]|nr:hypothetical protein [Candidatus Woesearchaeota archaeon]
MQRVMFDTNIYGFLLKEVDAIEIERRIIEDKEFIVYGYKPIRKEIRDIPKITKLSRKSRILLLCLYDRITEGHFLEHSIKITNLARRYYDCYRNLGVIYGWDTSMIMNLSISFMKSWFFFASFIAFSSFFCLFIVIL